MVFDFQRHSPDTLVHPVVKVAVCLVFQLQPQPPPVVVGHSGLLPRLASHPTAHSHEAEFQRYGRFSHGLHVWCDFFPKFQASVSERFQVDETVVATGPGFDCMEPLLGLSLPGLSRSVAAAFEGGVAGVHRADEIVLADVVVVASARLVVGSSAWDMADLELAGSLLVKVHLVGVRVLDYCVGFVAESGDNAPGHGEVGLHD